MDIRLIDNKDAGAVLLSAIDPGTFFWGRMGYQGAPRRLWLKVTIPGDPCLYLDWHSGNCYAQATMQYAYDFTRMKGILELSTWQ